jgi:hypothetical protein
MKRIYAGGLSRLATAATILAVTSSAPASPIGFEFGYVGVTMRYTYSPGPGGKVGVITLSSPGYLLLSKYDIGSDGFGGGNDVLLDVAMIIGSGDMDFSFSADVIKLASNSYKIQDVISGSDVDLLSSAYEANAASTAMTYIPLGTSGVLSFTGSLSTVLPNSSIPINRASGPNDWVFVGEGVPNPGVDPDEDGTEGTVTLPTGVGAFDVGAISFYQIGVGKAASLDAFFSADRTQTGGDLKMTVIPEPATLAILGLGALGLAQRLHRRRLP